MKQNGWIQAVFRKNCNRACSASILIIILGLCSCLQRASGQAGYLAKPFGEIIGPPAPPPWSTAERIGQQVRFPRVSVVSAMCTPEGITVQLTFDGPFYGKIYSYRYSTVHECVYYNHYDEEVILFSIPNYKCGVKIEKDSDNSLRKIENEIYVQYDKDYQNREDKRYLFVCDLHGTASIFPTIIPPPVFPPGNTPAFNGWQPTQGITVLPGEPTQLIGIGTGGPRPGIFMEIQDGLGPNKLPVRRTLQLGETITLVVKGKTEFQSNPGYDMFVSSCFANDGTAANKVEFIDQRGCTIRDQIAGNMQRTKSGSEIIYYVPLKAFKFPSSENVYFTCSVEVCATACNFPDICIGSRSQNLEDEIFPRTQRKRTASNVEKQNSSGSSALALKGPTAPMNEIVSAKHRVTDSVRIQDKPLEYANLTNWPNAQRVAQQQNTSETPSIETETLTNDNNSSSPAAAAGATNVCLGGDIVCMDSLRFGFLMTTTVLLLAVIVGMTVYLSNKRSSSRKQGTMTTPADARSISSCSTWYGRPLPSLHNKY